MWQKDPDCRSQIELKDGINQKSITIPSTSFTNHRCRCESDLKFKPSASEVEIKQRDRRSSEENQRKMVYSRNIAATSLVTLNAVCIALSTNFRCLVRYCSLILLAPLLKVYHGGRSVVSHVRKSDYYSALQKKFWGSYHGLSAAVSSSARLQKISRAPSTPWWTRKTSICTRICCHTMQ